MLAFCLFIRFIYNHLGDGPMWSYDGVFGTICTSKDVNAHLLFLSNWYPSNCMPWLWYTAVDFQLYLASPIILILLWRCSRFALATSISLVIASVVYMIVIYASYSLPTNIFADVLNEKSLESASTSFRLIYASPFARCAPFIIGILTGWNVFVRIENPPSVWTCTFLKVLVALLFYFAIFAPSCEQGLLSYVHAVLHRPVWSVALAILVWLCENGLAQEISYALSSRHFLLLTRLSFGVFLAHEPILLFFIWTSRQPHSPHSLAYFAAMTITTFVLSLLISLLIAILIEIPILSMEKKLFKTANQRLEDNVPEPQEEYTPLRQYYHYNEGNLATKELSFYEKTTSWLRAPEFERTMHGSREPTVMECASSFSMDSLVFCKTAEHLDEWSREESLAEKFEKKAEESLLKQKPLDIEQWERSLYSSC
ncbi:unnamed protein product [Cylicocyclus nassatus]|uniref:Acyltransferase 3 domain-containing protein n=1 Tax=Cylicocyclus nassatus TaxID=53992 RepID=A0AA36LZ93_CYLNA|nr:unnamed protein product [Cylicocyclus nassatus]